MLRTWSGVSTVTHESTRPVRGASPQTTNAICVSGVFDFHVREQRHVNSGRTDARATF